MKTYFQNKNFALRLALMMRLAKTRKWPIQVRAPISNSADKQYLSVSTHFKELALNNCVVMSFKVILELELVITILRRPPYEYQI